MSKKIVYVTVKMEIDNPNKDIITEEDVDEVFTNTDYSFGDVGDFHIDTEIVDYDVQNENYTENYF